MRRAVLQGVLFGLLAGCSSSDVDVQKFVAEVELRPASKIVPLPPMAPTAAVSGTYLRDPFQDITAIARPQSDGPTYLAAAPGPLARVEAEGLRLLRSYWDLDQPAALVESPDQDLFRLVLGDRVGGLVVSVIEAERLVLVDGRGREVTLTKN